MDKPNHSTASNNPQTEREWIMLMQGEFRADIRELSSNVKDLTNTMKSVEIDRIKPMEIRMEMQERRAYEQNGAIKAIKSFGGIIAFILACLNLYLLIKGLK